MSHFDDSELVVNGMEDPGTTGNFEVVNMATMELLYSKKVTGAKCVDEGERKALKEKIEKIIEG